MRYGFLTAAAILVANATSAWSQELESLPPPLIQVSSLFQSDAAGVLPATLIQLTENGTALSLTDNSSNIGNQNRFWGGAEALLWATKQGHTPPLVTSGTPPLTGILGEPGTTTLFGGDQDGDARLGGRFTMGYWLDSDQTRGIEASYFFLNGLSNNFSASSLGNPVLARPFINANGGLPSSQLISFPGVISGSVLVASSSLFQGAELNWLSNLSSASPMNCCPPNCCPTPSCQTVGYRTGNLNQAGYKLDLIGGFRYLNLNESLVITENLLILPTAPNPPFDPGATITVNDRFETRNDFYGGQIGARGEWYRGAWFTNVSGKVALGTTHQEVRINGSTTFTSSGGAVVTQPGGLLALPTNIGTYSRDQFSVVPEFGINVGRQLTDNVRIYTGYSLIYWSSVVRPGDQIDFTVNPTQLPTSAGPGVLVGPARPAFAFHDTDFWAQGINAGLQFGW